MKPAQLPIYRVAERLLQWAIALTSRLPKSLPFQILGGDMIRDIKTTLDAIVMAITTQDLQKRLMAIELLIVRMTSVKMTMRQLVQARTVKGAPVVSVKREIEFLDLANTLSAQAGAWQCKTATAVRS
jgi:hypothetical protein